MSALLMLEYKFNSPASPFVTADIIYSECEQVSDLDSLFLVLSDTVENNRQKPPNCCFTAVTMYFLV